MITTQEMSTDELVAELRLVGLLGSAPVSVATQGGPMMTRSQITAGARYVWADVVGSAWRGPDAAQLPHWLSYAATAAGNDEFGPVLPAVVGKGTWIYQFGWAPQLLVERLGASSDQGWVEAVMAAAGGYLRRLHDLDSRVWPAARPPVAVRRLIDPPAGALADDARWRPVVRRVVEMFAAGPASALHGQPAFAHLFVPEEPESDGPVACLTGWIEPCAGPRAFDVGHLMGDVLEVAGLTAAAGQEAASSGLIAAAAAVRRGYARGGADPLPPTMWADVAAAAVAKVLEHEIRMGQAFGPAGQSSRLLSSIAEALGDPSSALGAVLAEEADDD